MLNTIDALKFFIEKYGEKAVVLLRAMYELSQDPLIDHRLGDFSYKHLVLKLASMGFNYNPINILRVLEKELGVIEKSYTSSNQTWWRFTDIEAVRSVLGEILGVETRDPRVKALLIKYRSLEPRSILESLRRLAVKEHFSQFDKEYFKNFVYTTLDRVVDLMNEMEKYEEVFTGELGVLREILNLADLVSSKLDKQRGRLLTIGHGVFGDASTRSSSHGNPPESKGYSSLQIE
jgi:hypothetical protein